LWKASKIRLVGLQLWLQKKLPGPKHQIGIKFRSFHSILRGRPLVPVGQIRTISFGLKEKPGLEPLEQIRGNGQKKAFKKPTGCVDVSAFICELKFFFAKAQSQSASRALATIIARRPSRIDYSTGRTGGVVGINVIMRRSGPVKKLRPQ